MSVATRRRARVRVEGTVQGVGFRPYVHRLAGELGLAGYVLNDSRGVLLEIEGSSDAVDSFLARLGPDAPPLAVLESLTVVDREPTGDDGFEIRPSPHGERADVPVTPDSATCDDCLRELLDPSDRRYRYPFINCTNCGPRFTIVRGVPYDRPLTTMAGFQMCDAVPRRVRGPARPALPRPAQRVPSLRAVAVAARFRGPRGRSLGRRARGRGRRAARRCGRRDQGDRRIPPRLPGRRRGGGRRRCGRASTARTSRLR